MELWIMLKEQHLSSFVNHQKRENCDPSKIIQVFPFFFSSTNKYVYAHHIQKRKTTKKNREPCITRT